MHFFEVDCPFLFIGGNQCKINASHGRSWELNRAGSGDGERSASEADSQMLKPNHHSILAIPRLSGPMLPTCSPHHRPSQSPKHAWTLTVKATGKIACCHITTFLPRRSRTARLMFVFTLCFRRICSISIGGSANAICFWTIVRFARWRLRLAFPVKRKLTWRYKESPGKPLHNPPHFAYRPTDIPCPTRPKRGPFPMSRPHGPLQTPMCGTTSTTRALGSASSCLPWRRGLQLSRDRCIPLTCKELPRLSSPDGMRSPRWGPHNCYPFDVAQDLFRNLGRYCVNTVTTLVSYQRDWSVSCSIAYIWWCALNCIHVVFSSSVLPVATRNLDGRTRRSYEETVQILQTFMNVSNISVPSSNLMLTLNADIGRARRSNTEPTRESTCLYAANHGVPWRPGKGRHQAVLSVLAGATMFDHQAIWIGGPD